LDYKNISLDILQFSLSECDIYYEFNQIIIAFSSCLTCVKQKENDNNKIENIYQNMVSIIKNIKIDFSLIEKCMAKIINNLSSEDNNDDNNPDDESPKLNFQSDNIIFLTKIIENDIKNTKNKN
jgi:hypothetical protein